MWQKLSWGKLWIHFFIPHKSTWTKSPPQSASPLQMAKQDLSCANGCPRTPTRFQAFSIKVQIMPILSLILLTYGTKGGILNLLKANTPDGADVCLSHGHDHQHSEQDIGEGFAQEEGSEGVHSWCECGQPELQPCEFVRRVVQLFMEGSFTRRLLGKANHSKWRRTDPSTKVRKNIWFYNWFNNTVKIWNVCGEPMTRTNLKIRCACAYQNRPCFIEYGLLTAIKSNPVLE